MPLTLWRARGSALLFVGAQRFTQGEIKTNLGVLSLKIALRDDLAVGHFYRIGNQAVAGGKGKIVPQVFIAIEVNLAGQMFMTRRGDEKSECAPDGCRGDPVCPAVSGLGHPAGSRSRRA